MTTNPNQPAPNGPGSLGDGFSVLQSQPGSMAAPSINTITIVAKTTTPPTTSIITTPAPKTRTITIVKGGNLLSTLEDKEGTSAFFLNLGL